MFALLMMCVVAAALLAGKGFLVDFFSFSVSDSGNLVCRLQSWTALVSFGIAAPCAALVVVHCRPIRERKEVRGPPRQRSPIRGPPSGGFRKGTPHGSVGHPTLNHGNSSP